MVKYAPLSGGFMIASIVGFFVSTIYIVDLSLNYSIFALLTY